MTRIIRAVSVDVETDELIKNNFSDRSFSQWLVQQVKGYVTQKISLAKDPTIQSEIKDMEERAIQILLRKWGDSRTGLLAQRWEGMIREHGGHTSAEKLVEMAKVRRK